MYKALIYILFISFFYRISDEKDARGYLQVLAAKMKEELEYLKQCPTNNGQSALVWIVLQLYSKCGFDSIIFLCYSIYYVVKFQLKVV